MKTSHNTTTVPVKGAAGQPGRLLLALVIALLVGCGGGEDAANTGRSSTMPVDCKAAPADCA